MSDEYDYDELPSWRDKARMRLDKLHEAIEEKFGYSTRRLLKLRVEFEESQAELWERRYRLADKAARDFRSALELANLNPEVKADIEGAFLRGEASGRKKLASSIYGILSGMEQ